MRVELFLGDPFRVVSHSQIPQSAGAPHPRLLSANPSRVSQALAKSHRIMYAMSRLSETQAELSARHRTALRLYGVISTACVKPLRGFSEKTHIL